MIGITLTTDQIRNAPAEVRRWIEHEVIASLGLAADAPKPTPPQASRLAACSLEDAKAVLAQILGVLPALSVYFELARPGVSFGEPAVMAYRLIDLLHHTKLQNTGQVIACLEMMNQALAGARGDPSVRFCSFDSEGHCLIAPTTQRSIAQLWTSEIASHNIPGGELPRTLIPAA